MKAFKVFWKDRIVPDPAPYCAEAIVIAENITQALAISESYGEVSTIFQEKMLIDNQMGMAHASGIPMSEITKSPIKVVMGTRTAAGVTITMDEPSLPVIDDEVAYHG